MGTGTTHDQPDNSRQVTAIHRLVATRPPRATTISPPAAGSGRRAGDPREGRRDGQGHEPDERSGRPRTRAPHEEARSEKAEAGEAFGRRANGTGASARIAEIREGMPAPDGRRRARPAAEEGCDAARREVSTGTN